MEHNGIKAAALYGTFSQSMRVLTMDDFFA
jgi:hypothetical protein